MDRVLRIMTNHYNELMLIYIELESLRAKAMVDEYKPLESWFESIDEPEDKS